MAAAVVLRGRERRDQRTGRSGIPRVRQVEQQPPVLRAHARDRLHAEHLRKRQRFGKLVRKVRGVKPVANGRRTAGRSGARGHMNIGGGNDPAGRPGQTVRKGRLQAL